MIMARLQQSVILQNTARQLNAAAAGHSTAPVIIGRKHLPDRPALTGIWEPMNALQVPEDVTLTPMATKHANWSMDFISGALLQHAPAQLLIAALAAAWHAHQIHNAPMCQLQHALTISRPHIQLHAQAEHAR